MPAAAKRKAVEENYEIYRDGAEVQLAHDNKMARRRLHPLTELVNEQRLLDRNNYPAKNDEDYDLEEEDDGDKDIHDRRDVPSLDGVVDEDLENFRATLKGPLRRYRLIQRIGEGTFSTVYKAEDTFDKPVDRLKALENQRSRHAAKKFRYTVENGANRAGSHRFPDLLQKKQLDYQERQQLQDSSRKAARFVAIKKIYVTSSPARIQNELELLYDLRGCADVCPLITAFRLQDQVIAILPYYRHYDFREFFRDMLACDMRDYFRSLFGALASVHKQGILHRDIKPTNFLYDVPRKRGVLVDFGLAERECRDPPRCVCQDLPWVRKRKVESSHAIQQFPARGYPKDDVRPPRRANRAGTRGFRAPEVLFKCTSQTTKIDIWSAGVILLTILARRFPFFNSTDDVEALIEITTIFGRRRMRHAALQHGAIFESTIPTLSERGFTLEKIVLWSTGKWRRGPDGEDGKLWPGEASAVRLLERCMALDPAQRISAEEALQHEFLNVSPETEEAEAEELDRMYAEREREEQEQLELAREEEELEEGEEEEEEEEEQEDI